MEKQPGQFGLFALFVLMTLAAIAFAIVRLPIPLVGKMLSLVALWVCFSHWAGPSSDPRLFGSPEHLRRLALLSAVGSVVSFAPLIWIIYDQRGNGPLSFLDVAFGILVLLVVGRAIWQAIKSMRPETRRASPMDSP